MSVVYSWLPGRIPFPMLTLAEIQRGTVSCEALAERFAMPSERWTREDTNYEEEQCPRTQLCSDARVTNWKSGVCHLLPPPPPHRHRQLVARDRKPDCPRSPRVIIENVATATHVPSPDQRNRKGSNRPACKLG